MTLEIDTELQDLIPPLADSEYKQLERNIISDGCREPLAVWQDVIIDGHNRFNICSDNDIDFDVVHMDFDSKTAVKVWMINNQEGRRSLTDGWRFDLAHAKKEFLLEVGKAAKISAGSDYGEGHKKSEVLSTIDKTSEKPETHNTRNEIAKDLGWSTGKVAMADKVWKESTPEVKAQVKSGEVSINQAYKEIKTEEELINDTAKEIKENKPVIHHTDYGNLFHMLDKHSMDLLITDPPYSTDIDDIEGFVDDWLFDA